MIIRVVFVLFMLFVAKDNRYCVSTLTEKMTYLYFAPNMGICAFNLSVRATFFDMIIHLYFQKRLKQLLYCTRAVSILVSKWICVCFGVVLLRPLIGQYSQRHFLNHWDAVVTCTRVFSALGGSVNPAQNSDWLTVVFTFCHWPEKLLRFSLKVRLFSSKDSTYLIILKKRALTKKIWLHILYFYAETLGFGLSAKTDNRRCIHGSFITLFANFCQQTCYILWNTRRNVLFLWLRTAWLRGINYKEVEEPVQNTFSRGIFCSPHFWRHVIGYFPQMSKWSSKKIQDMCLSLSKFCPSFQIVEKNNRILYLPVSCTIQRMLCSIDIRLPALDIP